MSLDALATSPHLEDLHGVSTLTAVDEKPKASFPRMLPVLVGIAKRREQCCWDDFHRVVSAALRVGGEICTAAY